MRGTGFDWCSIGPAYYELIETCLSIRCVTENNLSLLVSAAERFNKTVRHLGISFITKHMRFWLHRSLGDNSALSIYDSIMARNVMGKDAARSKDLEEYWTIMYKKAQDLQIGLVPFERQLFRYFYPSRMTYKGFSFKYYRGEDKNPFQNTSASMWWDGEKLFYDIISRQDGDAFVERIKEGYEDALSYSDTSEIHKNKSLTKKDHILLFYLDLWHRKWFPYDNYDVIEEYNKQ